MRGGVSLCSISESKVGITFSSIIYARRIALSAVQDLYVWLQYPRPEGALRIYDVAVM